MMHQVLQHSRNWNQVVLTTNVKIFAPVSTEEIENSKQPVEIEERSYRQKIYWQAGSLLVVEILDDQNQVLHFYYKSKGYKISVMTQEKRYFSLMDVLPAYLQFVTHRASDWQSAADGFNIQNDKITFFRDDNFTIYYRIGDIKTQNFALIDKERFLLSSLQYEVSNSEQQLIRIRFKDMTTYGNLEYPKQTEYFLNQQLFKQVIVESLEPLKELPLEQLHQKAMKWSQGHSLSIQTDFTR